MPPAGIVRDKDVATLSDEELVRLVRKSRSVDALVALTERHLPSVRRVLDAWGQKVPLSLEDQEDVRQEAFLFLLRAVREYNANRTPPHTKSRFRTFLGSMILSKFQDFLRRLRRRERRIDRSISAEDILRTKAVPPEQFDPTDVAVRDEQWQKLAAALCAFDKPYRRLFNDLELGRSLHAIAANLGWSYDRVKRMRRKMLAQLTNQLRDETDQLRSVATKVHRSQTGGASHGAPVSVRAGNSGLR
jgi:RNA polymerase sigma factor (sigma-70 family)